MNFEIVPNESFDEKENREILLSPELILLIKGSPSLSRKRDRVVEFILSINFG